jgi:hypothetical protein
VYGFLDTQKKETVQLSFKPDTEKPSPLFVLRRPTYAFDETLLNLKLTPRGVVLEVAISCVEMPPAFLPLPPAFFVRWPSVFASTLTHAVLSVWPCETFWVQRIHPD